MSGPSPSPSQEGSFEKKKSPQEIAVETTPSSSQSSGKKKPESPSPDETHQFSRTPSPVPPNSLPVQHSETSQTNAVELTTNASSPSTPDQSTSMATPVSQQGEVDSMISSFGMAADLDFNQMNLDGFGQLSDEDNDKLMAEFEKILAGGDMGVDMDMTGLGNNGDVDKAEVGEV